MAPAEHDDRGAQLIAAHRLDRLVDAIILVGSDLDLPTMLHRIVEAATELVDARYGALGVLDPARTGLEQFITVGLDPDEVAAIGALPEGKGILGLLIVEPRALRLEDLHDHPDSFGFPPNHPPMTRFLGVPVLVRGEAFGNLYLCDKRDGTPFTTADEQLVTALAASAGVAVEHTWLHEQLAQLGVLADRERIARELHDTVIQRIFATGLALGAVAARVSDPNVAERLQAAVDDLDDTVRQIRTTIFELQQRRLPGRSVRGEILDMVRDAAQPLGFEPIVRFEGLIDLGLPADVADNLIASAREAITNVVKHAGATRVEVRVAAEANRLRMEVIDDGRGIDTSAATDDLAGHGLRNLAARAANLGGSLQLLPAEGGGGTHLVWDVPVPD